MSRCDLLTLQGRAKRDPEGYRDDVLMQLQHYNALHGLFMLKPGKDFREFADLVGFLAQVAASYKTDIPAFHVGLIELLEKHYALLDPHLRRSLVSALILLRNRGSATAAELLPLFFKLFRCQDKQLRVMIFRHIVADVKGANKVKRNDSMNRQVQNFLAAALKDENETAAKKALAVITELYRRNIWSDARTVNLVADACRHKSPKILVAALKFFLGQDEAAEAAAEAGDDSDDDDDVDKPKTGVGTAAGTSSGVSKEDVYKAYNKGVSRTKAKKQAKLKRQMASIRKATRREDGNNGEARFAAMQLVNDPQSFAEHLFGRLQNGSALKFDTKMLLIQVLSRVVGLHRLHLLHLYPFLQRYVQPNQREVTRLLASAATACHELVPPDALEPLLRQLVNQFVHDRARPEVVAVGINTVREICVRCPLVMHGDLLQDLAQYKRARDKPVATAARALIALFRELAPGMLEKKDRGKGADLEKTVAAFGEFKADDRVAGAELLQKDAAKRRRLERAAAAEEAAGAAEEAGAGEESDEDAGDDASLGSDDDAEDASDSDGGELLSDDDDDDDDEDEEDGEDVEDGEEEEVSVSGSDGDFDVDPEEEDEYGRVLDPKTGLKRKYIQPALTLAQKRDMATRAVAEAEARGEAAPKVRKNGILSLSELKRRAKAAAKTRRAAEAAEAEENAVVSDSEEDLVEHTRVLDPEDFRRIKALQTKGKLDDAMDKSGARKAKETAAEEMRRMLRLADRSTVADRRVNPDALMAVGLRKAHDKETRVASIMAGREDRGEFGSSQERKNKKTGGTTNVEKKKRKNMPLAARVMAAGRRRRGGAKFGAAKAVKDKQFKGKFRKGAN